MLEGVREGVGVGVDAKREIEGVWRRLKYVLWCGVDVERKRELVVVFVVVD